MRLRRVGIVLAAAAVAARGGDAGQGDAAVALDSVGGTTNSDPGRSDRA